ATQSPTIHRRVAGCGAHEGQNRVTRRDENAGLRYAGFGRVMRRGREAMTEQPSRREVLITATALTAAGAMVGAAPLGGHGARNGAPIDAVLRAAVDAKEVPGVVAMATTDKSVIYEGAFGTRDLGKGPAMTRDTVFRIASMTK